ncbi:hypothetical protein BpHYR1_002042 [Brachionus plicatilis]|uniref:Uncharacterized protein n=1 Tax=Brachionus plicatilis TaxID=10195 RepID=A0A3M7T113_BRAPC|nr:hypothetical protein BpHYR1_002042 [Brachionus plicatilis]
MLAITQPIITCFDSLIIRLIEIINIIIKIQLEMINNMSNHLDSSEFLLGENDFVYIDCMLFLSQMTDICDTTFYLFLFYYSIVFMSYSKSIVRNSSESRNPSYQHSCRKRLTTIQTKSLEFLNINF